MKPSSRRSARCVLTAAAFTLLLPSQTSALTISGLKGQGLEKIYGSYAPRGNCAAEPRVTIDDKGFTFRANGRTLLASKVEYAVSYMGQSYEGIASVFFPFPRSEDDFGPVVMTVNDGEKRGVIGFGADLRRGQRADPFHAALTSASPFTLCKGTAATPAAAPVTPAGVAPRGAKADTAAEWTNLPSLVGRYPGNYAADNVDLFERGAIATALRNRLGAKMAVLKTNLSVVGPLQRQGALYYVSGNAQHQGGVEQAYVLIDAARRAVQVGLWEKGKLTVYAPTTGARLSLPTDLAKMVQNSPPETAVALTGSPWEIVPVQGGSPLAHVAAAGSPNIEAFSFFCQAGRPMMAMLLNKPSRSPALTVTWDFAGALVNIPVSRGNREGTFWQASLAGSPLIAQIMRGRANVMLRLNGQLEGEASLSNAGPTLRTAMRPCLRL